MLSRKWEGKRKDKGCCGREQKEGQSSRWGGGRTLWESITTVKQRPEGNTFPDIRKINHTVAEAASGLAHCGNCQEVGVAERYEWCSKWYLTKSKKKTQDYLGPTPEVKGFHFFPLRVQWKAIGFLMDKMSQSVLHGYIENMLGVGRCIEAKEGVGFSYIGPQHLE